MATVLGLWAKKANNTMSKTTNLLPSPISVTPTIEQIWDENTGRAQSGSNSAMMIGDVIAEKHTYAVVWDMLTQTEFDKITTLLPTGFFYFGLGTVDTENSNNNVPPSGAVTYYRSEISYELLQVGSTLRYRNIKVSIIEQ
jgi:hypothetical protein